MNSNYYSNKLETYIPNDKGLIWHRTHYAHIIGTYYYYDCY